jgi:uncharacterized protein
MTIPSVPDYEQVDSALNRTGALSGAAETHGALCGMLCVGGGRARESWIAEVLVDAAPADLLARESGLLLAALHDETQRQLDASGLEFQMLLPDDARPLAERAEALGGWCRGFMSGLGLAGLTQERIAQGEVRELLRDLTEIAQVEFDIGEGSEGDEGAYAEIVEYVRVAVLTLYDELHADRKPPLLQ